MTTISWDGKEMVADSLGLPFVRNANNEISYTGEKKTNVVKILDGARFTMGDHAVQAIGVSGDFNMMQNLIGLQNWAVKNNQMVDLSAADLYASFVAQRFPFAIMLVLQNVIVIVRWDELCGDAGAQYDVYERTGGVLVIGSGKDAARPYINWMGVTARFLVSAASGKDKFTGGDLVVWKDGQITVGVKPFGLVGFLRRALAMAWRTQLEFERRKQEVKRLERKEKRAAKREHDLAYKPKL